MRKLLASVAFIGALSATAAQATPARTHRGDAVVFLSHVVGLIAANDYHSAYALLHPAQQRLVSEQEYVACELQSPVPGTLSSLRVLRTMRQRIHVAGTDATRVPSTAVTFELLLKGQLPGESARIDLTAHAVSVAGRWRWILSARRLALHRAGCGIVAS